MAVLFFYSLAPAKSKSKTPTYFEYRERICAQARKEACEPQNVASPIMEVANLSLMQACNDYYKANHCEEIKASLAEKDRDLLLSCKSEAICKDDTNLDLVKCSIDGGKTQFEIPALALSAGVAAGASLSGATGAMVSVTMLPLTIYGASKEAAACDKDMDHKLIMIKMHNLSLLPNESALDPQDKNKDVLKMPCEDLKKFLQTRLEVLASKREKNATLSPLAKEMLESLQSTRCYNPQLVKEHLCQSVASFIVGSVVGGVAGFATKKAFALKNSELISRNTVTKGLPGVDRDSFARDIKNRRAQWNAEHPLDKNNFPMPEHKDGIDFIKQSLIKIKDSKKTTSDMVDIKKRSQDAEALLKDIETLDKNNYPNMDSLNLARRSLYLLDHASERKQITFSDLSHELRTRFNYEPKISREAADRLNTLQNKIYNTPRGRRHEPAVAAFEKEMIKILQADTDRQNIKIDVAKELKRLVNQNADEAPRPYGSEHMQQQLEKHTLVITGRELNVRDIGEATLYDIHIAGVVDKRTKADGDSKAPTHFFDHDIAHAEQASLSQESLRLRSLPNSEKQKILNAIDSIADPKEKALAEYSLMAVLRESTVFDPRTKPYDIQGNYQTVMGSKLSDKDATWMINWARENLSGSK